MILLMEAIRRRTPLRTIGPDLWRGDCPLCEAPDGLCVDPTGWYCRSCDAYGDLVSFVMQFENVGFIDAVNWIARDAGFVP